MKNEGPNRNPDTLKQTTLRLPVEVHRQLRITAAEQHTTSEAILLEALRRELERRGFGAKRSIEVPSEMNPVLAELFLQSMPTFALIKDERARIVWVNHFFEKALQVPLLHVVGCTITEVGLIEGIQKETIDANIWQALKDRKPKMSVEGMDLRGLGPVTVRAQRYVFRNSLLGDISFVERDIKDRRFKVESDILQRMQSVVPSPVVEDLLVPFLEAAPVSIAIKRPVPGDTMIVWANREYVKLAKAKRADDVFGRTTRDVFRLELDHPIARNEFEVTETGLARMAKETLPGRPPRWSLRFPIVDGQGRVVLIGVVSPDFRQDAATTRF